jgi:hypothetical protein
MNTDTLILLTECCVNLGVNISFVRDLEAHGLIEIITVEQNLFIDEIQLPRLEKIARLYELEINIPGIEAITHLLDCIDQLQDNITELQNKLRLYE